MALTRPRPPGRPGPPAGRSPAATARPRFRILRGDAIALGPGKADLLEAIEAAGSISAAGRRLGMSYRRAWVLIDTMNRCFRSPLVAASRGGGGGGGARLTPAGRRVLRLYRDIEAAAEAAARPRLRALQRLLRPSGTAR